MLAQRLEGCWSVCYRTRQICANKEGIDTVEMKDNAFWLELERGDPSLLPKPVPFQGSGSQTAIDAIMIFKDGVNS